MTREELVAQEVTLDGRPAVIAGRLNPHATVAQIPGGLTIEVAWPTVERIVADRGGRFYAGTR